MVIEINTTPEWVSDLWAAAKTAGPFGNLLLLSITGILWRNFRKAQEAILQLTISGLKSMSGIEAALLGIQTEVARKQTRRKNAGKKPRKTQNKRRS